MWLILSLVGCDAFLLEPCPGRVWSEVSAGYVHICAIDGADQSKGEAVCAVTNGSDAVETAVPDGPWSAITGGYGYACALDATGAASCWGDLTQLGEDTPEGSGLTLAALDGGPGHVCGIDEAGVVHCWGKNAARTAVPDGLAGAGQISAGSEHTCALDDSGALSCWGTAGDWLPEDGSGTWDLVAAGDDFTCAWDGSAMTCWGAAAPQDTAVFDGARLESLSAGALGLCGVDADGALICALNEDADLPADTVKTVDLSAQAASIAGESYGGYGCALTTDGLLECFGAGPRTLPE